MREKIVRDYLNKHDVYSGFLLDVLKVEYTPTVDEPYLELLVPVHTSNTYGHVLENATALRIVVGERWEGFNPTQKHSFTIDDLERLVQQGEQAREYLQNKSDAERLEFEFNHFHGEPRLQHKLPEDLEGSTGYLINRLFKATVELQEIVLKLMQEKR